jgi:membrane peptidoglycan carboxypeptidase
MDWRVRLQADLSRIHQLACAEADEGAGELSALELMTIVLEDRRFFNHAGVDLRSVAREVIKTLALRKHGGASTIDMQFVRTATGYRANSMGRKVYEAFLAMLIQRRYRKRQILRSYIDCAYFGSGLIGANAAALKVCGKAPARLDLNEAALVAAMLAYPRPLNGSAAWRRRVEGRAAYAIRVYSTHQRLFPTPPMRP